MYHLALGTAPRRASIFYQIAETGTFRLLWFDEFYAVPFYFLTIKIVMGEFNGYALIIRLAAIGFKIPSGSGHELHAQLINCFACDSALG